MKASDSKFLVDATQTAYLWHYRNQYGDRASAVRALRKRRSASGRRKEECESAFDLGRAVVKAAGETVLGVPRTMRLSEADAKRVAETVAAEVQKAVTGSTPEMVEYAMGMLFWMPPHAVSSNNDFQNGLGSLTAEAKVKQMEVEWRSTQ